MRLNLDLEALHVETTVMQPEDTDLEGAYVRVPLRCAFAFDRPFDKYCPHSRCRSLKTADGCRRARKTLNWQV